MTHDTDIIDRIQDMLDRIAINPGAVDLASVSDLLESAGEKIGELEGLNMRLGEGYAAVRRQLSDLHKALSGG